MNIALGCDYGGYELKETLKNMLESLGHTWEDFGCGGTPGCDYPDFAVPAARAVANGKCERGILICSTGIGMSIAANKIPGVRCAHCADTLQAEMSRRHNDANMIALGAGHTGTALARKMVEVFLTAPFDGGRHQRRVDKIMALDGLPERASALEESGSAAEESENAAEQAPEQTDRQTEPARTPPEQTET